MYILMVKYIDSLNDDKHLDGSIEMLDQTRKIIEVFRDSRPLCDINDKHFQILQDVETWLIKSPDSVPEDEKKEIILDHVQQYKYGINSTIYVKLQCQRKAMPVQVKVMYIQHPSQWSPQRRRS